MTHLPLQLTSEVARPVLRETGRNGPGALVIGGDYQGLGIARSLGRHGVPVYILDDERSIARFSRYVTRTVKTQSLRRERETVDILLDLARRFDLNGWVLYPTRDETVAALSRHRESLLAARFSVPTPPWNVVEWVWNKRNTYTLAEQLHIPIPRTWYPQSIDDVRRIEGPFPLALKPAIKENFIYATKVKAWRANSLAELEALYERAVSHVNPSEVIIQDLIPGDGREQFAYCAFFKQKQALGSVVVRRARQHPPEFGRASTFVETIDLPLLETLSARFLEAIDYYGLVELEYKRDPRDGQYKLLDVNARTWGYHTIGAKAGVDFAHMLFLDQSGRPCHSKRGASGVRWIRLLTDLPAGLMEVWSGRLSLRAYLRSLATFQEEACFSWDDPLPGLAELALVPYLAARRGY
jgi:D-aspartate ligase